MDLLGPVQLTFSYSRNVQLHPSIKLVQGQWKPNLFPQKFYYIYNSLKFTMDYMGSSFRVFVSVIGLASLIMEMLFLMQPFKVVLYGSS